MNLAWIDYLIIFIYLLTLIGFGSYFARFQKTTRDYFLTDRTVPWWGTCFSIVATETSTLTFIGVPALAYATDMSFLQLAFGYVIGRLLVALFFIPIYFKKNLVTSYELLHQRFGPAVKTLAAVIFLVTRSLADGVRLFATALVLSIVTQIPVTWIIVGLGAAMIIYTERGGVSAVIWTDVVQMFVYMAGAAIVFLALLNRIPGGWPEVVRVGLAEGKFTVFSLSINPRQTYTLWAGLFGGVALTLATHGTDQFFVQRLLATRSAAAAARGLIASGIIVFAQFTLFLIIGVMLYVYYQHFPPATSLLRDDAVLPVFIAEALTNGVAGFIVAAIIAAALSPSLNAMAATTVNDLYRQYASPSTNDADLLRISRLATIGWGVVQIVIAISVQWVNQSVLDSGLAVLSLTAGPILGAFLLAIGKRNINSSAVIIGMLAGTCLLGVVLYQDVIAWTWYSLIGTAATIFVALLLDAKSVHRDS